MMLDTLKKLPRKFYARDTATVARDLLGMYLVHVVDGVQRIGRIVETEAYVGAHDLASHSARGITERTRVMYGPPGFAYVYLIYGMHHCMNVVTERAGHGAAVLLRALEPVENLAGKTSGPGLLSRAMGIDRSHNVQDLQGRDFYIAAPAASEAFTIVQCPRIGVAYAGEWALRDLRFYIEGNLHVSRKRPA